MRDMSRASCGSDNLQAEARLAQLGLGTDCAELVRDRAKELTRAELAIKAALAVQLKVSHSDLAYLSVSTMLGDCMALSRLAWSSHIPLNARNPRPPMIYA